MIGLLIGSYSLKNPTKTRNFWARAFGTRLAIAKAAVEVSSSDDLLISSQKANKPSVKARSSPYRNLRARNTEPVILPTVPLQG
jgi:hypothetical protein